MTVRESIFEERVEVFGSYNLKQSFGSWIRPGSTRSLVPLLPSWVTEI